jgi:maltose phosphorylase
MKEKAYEMYVRTARLDLDDYNNDTEDGLHITSMAGTWMSVVKGFAGQRVKDGFLHLNPYLPSEWSSFSFRIGFQQALLHVEVNRDAVVIQNISDHDLTLYVLGERMYLGSNAVIQKDN